MTTFIAKVPVRKKAVKKKLDRSWVVYPRRVGRTEAGIYQRNVSLDKERRIAFVHPVGTSMSADILPIDNVFATKEAAIQYKDGGGKRCWVVHPDSSYKNQLPEIFEAWVTSYTHERFGRGTKLDFSQAIKRVDTGELIHNNSYHGYQTFNTKKEALVVYREFYKRCLTTLQKKKLEYDDALKKLRETRVK